MRDHGVNILLNVFCGPVVNAARGVAMQELWLKIVPDYTVSFVRLILFLCMQFFESISNTMITLMLATGKIQKLSTISSRTTIE